MSVSESGLKRTRGVFFLRKETKRKEKSPPPKKRNVPRLPVSAGDTGPDGIEYVRSGRRRPRRTRGSCATYGLPRARPEVRTPPNPRRRGAVRVVRGEGRCGITILIDHHRSTTKPHRRSCLRSVVLYGEARVAFLVLMTETRSVVIWSRHRPLMRSYRSTR